VVGRDARAAGANHRVPHRRRACEGRPAGDREPAPDWPTPRVATVAHHTRCLPASQAPWPGGPVNAKNRWPGTGHGGCAGLPPARRPGGRRARGALPSAEGRIRRRGWTLLAPHGATRGGVLTETFEVRQPPATRRARHGQAAKSRTTRTSGSVRKKCWWAARQGKACFQSDPAQPSESTSAGWTAMKRRKEPRGTSLAARSGHPVLMIDFAHTSFGQSLRVARSRGGSGDRERDRRSGGPRVPSNHGGDPAQRLAWRMTSARHPGHGPAGAAVHAAHERSPTAGRVHAVVQQGGPDIVALREARFAGGLWCVRCGSRRVQRWGKAHGRQRYRCRTCGRTFSDLTGTPLAYSKRVELWGEYARCMLEAVSVREAARRLGMNKDTAFRWRHRILAVLERATHPAPQGIVELCETRFPHSEKGRRIPGRNPRRRGIPPGREYRADSPWVCVVVACDRAGGATSGSAGRGRPRAVVLREWLLPALGRPCTLVGTAGRYSAYALACARTDVVYHQAPRHPSAARRGAFLLDSTARAQARVVRLRTWLRRFRGVATRYLDNYLRWHLAVDAEPTGLVGPAGGWALVGLGRIPR